MHWDYFWYTDRGTRAENEDSVCCGMVGPQKLYALLADGLGGHGGGAQASATAVEMMRDCFCGQDFPTADTARQWLCQVNEHIRRQQRETRQMKTTLVFLFAGSGRVLCGHIGDSRLYHYHNERLVSVTQDHSVTQIAVLQGEITRDQMAAHADRARLLRALGSEECLPDLRQTDRLAPGRHAFLLCSDGFWEALREAEIGLDLHKSGTPQQWIEYLRGRAETRRAPGAEVDNNTAAAVFMEESE